MSQETIKCETIGDLNHFVVNAVMNVEILAQDNEEIQKECEIIREALKQFTEKYLIKKVQ